MLKRLLKGSSLAITLLCALPASAGFVHQDYKEVGDGKITLHEETGIEWLTLNETMGFSINAVSSMLGPGSKFDGWRLPTGEEVEALLSAALPLTFDNSTPDAPTIVTSISSVYANAWFEWMGFIKANASFSHSLGMYKATMNENDVLVSGVSKAFSSYNAYDDNKVGYSTSFTNPYYGVFLVRGGIAEQPSTPGGANDVPSPLPMPLLGLGAMLFAAWRGRRV